MGVGVGEGAGVAWTRAAFAWVLARASFGCANGHGSVHERSLSDARAEGVVADVELKIKINMKGLVKRKPSDWRNEEGIQKDKS